MFNVPLSISLAQDGEWSSIDDSPRTRMLIWGILSSANVVTGHILHQFKMRFDLSDSETQGAVYAHLRAEWVGYLSQLLQAENSPSEEAAIKYFGVVFGDAETLNLYGMHMMKVFHNQLYQVNSQADNYTHFSAIISRYAPELSSLTEAEAKAFFEDSKIAKILASEAHWVNTVREAAIVEENAAELNQNLHIQVMTAMRRLDRPEFRGVAG